MGILGTRMFKELKGEPQYELTIPKSKKGIATTRTFDKMTDDLENLKERVSTFSFKCAEKLRGQGSCCNHVTVFLTTNYFREDLRQYNNSITITLPNPSNSAIEINKYALKALE